MLIYIYNYSNRCRNIKDLSRDKVSLKNIKQNFWKIFHPCFFYAGVCSVAVLPGRRRGHTFRGRLRHGPGFDPLVLCDGALCPVGAAHCHLYCRGGQLVGQLPRRPRVLAHPGETRTRVLVTKAASLCQPIWSETQTSFVVEQNLFLTCIYCIHCRVGSSDFPRSLCFMWFWFGLEILRLVLKKAYFKILNGFYLIWPFNFPKNSSTSYKSWKKISSKLEAKGIKRREILRWFQKCAELLRQEVPKDFSQKNAFMQSP